jgi:hypothetical protein
MRALCEYVLCCAGVVAVALSVLYLTGCAAKDGNLGIAQQIGRGVAVQVVAEYCAANRAECVGLANRYGPALRGEQPVLAPADDKAEE